MCRSRLRVNGQDIEAKVPLMWRFWEWLLVHCKLAGKYVGLGEYVERERGGKYTGVRSFV
jgi:hypothetical protein